MADDPSPLPRESSRNHLVCEFCECRLSSTGDVLSRSKKARAMMDLDDDNDKLRKQIEAKDAKIAELEKDLAEAKKNPEPVPAGDPNNW